VLQAESYVCDSIGRQARKLEWNWINVVRGLLGGTDEVSVAALKGEAMREYGEPANNIRDRIIDGSQSQCGNGPLPGVDVTTVLYKLPGFGECFQG